MIYKFEEPVADKRLKEFMDAFRMLDRFVRAPRHWFNAAGVPAVIRGSTALTPPKRRRRETAAVQPASAKKVVEEVSIATPNIKDIAGGSAEEETTKEEGPRQSKERRWYLTG